MLCLVLCYVTGVLRGACVCTCARVRAWLNGPSAGGTSELWSQAELIENSRLPHIVNLLPISHSERCFLLQ